MSSWDKAYLIVSIHPANDLLKATFLTTTRWAIVRFHNSCNKATSSETPNTPPWLSLSWTQSLNKNYSYRASSNIVDWINLKKHHWVCHLTYWVSSLCTWSVWWSWVNTVRKRSIGRTIGGGHSVWRASGLGEIRRISIVILMNCR